MSRRRECEETEAAKALGTALAKEVAREAEHKAAALQAEMQRKEHQAAELQAQLAQAKREQLEQAQAMVEQSVIMAAKYDLCPPLSPLSQCTPMQDAPGCRGHGCSPSGGHECPPGPRAPGPSQAGRD